MINNEEINDEVFEEFLSANVYISMGVLGGWMAKHALGVLPRWLGGPSLASLIHKVGNNTINLIDGQGTFLMGLIGAHVGSLEIKKSDIRTQLRHINDLTQSETLKPEGAENPLPLIEYSDYKQQYRYYTEGIKGAKLNQVIDFGWLAFPFVMNKAVQQGLKRMATSLENKDAKFEVLSLNERRLYEWRANYSLNHRKKLLQYAFKDLKNPEKSLDLSDLHVGLNKALALAKNPMERAAIKESYENIILEFGPRLEKVIDHPALLDSYSRAMFGPEGTSAQAIQFYEEFRLIALRKMGAA